MPSYKFSCSFHASVEGDYSGRIDIADDCKTKEDIISAAEEELHTLIEEAIAEGHHDVSITSVRDLHLDDVEREICAGCKGKGFTLVALDEGAGLMKASPCSRCQRVPNTIEACKAVLEIIEEKDEEV